MEVLPVPYLRALCTIANAAPHVTDYYAALDLPKGASDALIKKTFRSMAIKLHPDKVGDNPELLAKYHKIVEANEKLTKPESRKEYDEAIENQELNELIPRCVQFFMMMIYWLGHCVLDWNEVEEMRGQRRKMLRKYIIDGNPLNWKALGITQDNLIDYCRADEECDLPFLTGKDDVSEFRRVLKTNGVVLDKTIEGEDAEMLFPRPKQVRPATPKPAEAPKDKEGAGESKGEGEGEPAAAAPDSAPPPSAKIMGIPKMAPAGIAAGASMRNFKKKKNRADAYMRKYGPNAKSRFSNCNVM